MSLPRVIGADWQPAHQDAAPVLRIHAADGQLTTRQLRTAGEVSRRYARDFVAVTGRQLQLSFIRAQQFSEATALLRAAGLTVARAPDGAAPVFVGSPVAGIAADEIIDGTPALREIRDRQAVRAGFGALPAAFTTTVSGSSRPDVLHEASDLSFTGVRHPDLGPGFDVQVGAALPRGPIRAGRLGVFVPLGEVPAVWAAIVSAFRDFGYRRLGRREHLTLLTAESQLAAGEGGGFRRLIEGEYLHHSLADGYAPPAPAGPRDHIGVHAQRDGRCYVGVTPGAGGALLVALADLAEAHGSTRVRITPYQKLIVLDIPPSRVESFCGSLERIGLTARPGLSHRRSTGWWRS